jgi:hypothetical protein
MKPNNIVNIKRFIRTMAGATFCSRISRSAAMFLFNRSALAVCLALAVAGTPILIQFFGFA